MPPDLANRSAVARLRHARRPLLAPEDARALARSLRRRETALALRLLTHGVCCGPLAIELGDDVGYRLSAAGCATVIRGIFTCAGASRGNLLYTILTGLLRRYPAPAAPDPLASALSPALPDSVCRLRRVWATEGPVTGALLLEAFLVAFPRAAAAAVQVAPRPVLTVLRRQGTLSQLLEHPAADVRLALLTRLAACPHSVTRAASAEAAGTADGAARASTHRLRSP